MREAAKSPNDLERLFVERANAGDVEGLLALYEEGAVVDLGGGETARGRDQIRRSLARFLARRPRLGPSRQAEPLLCGDLALTSSRLENGELTAEVARRQRDGTWRWVLDRFAL